DAALAQIPDGQSKQDGIAVGAEAAAAMIAARDGDGSFPPQFFPPPPPAPGVWQATPNCSPAGGVFYHVRNVRPFGLDSGDQFRSGPPPAITSSRYTRDYRESKLLGRFDSPYRPQDRSDVARYYAAVLGVQTWNPAVRQVAAVADHTITYNARALALVNMAVVDGLIAVMDAKYTYVWWRPETAIKNGDNDTNPRTEGDPLWAPFINVPCHPDYPSAHAVLAGGARELAERFYGGGGHSITLQHTLVPGIVLHYTRFRDIAKDIDDARIYGGVHVRYDQEEGARLGKKVGLHLYRHVLRRTDDVAEEEGVSGTDSRE
ncbi:MAG TPA: vanadium-dependent haloperoxidase, partial [Vicinamibacteria bacterium]|nr:vanadium-dependent haloperoxidase [Vicinamibacteria bacterium]